MSETIDVEVIKEILDEFRKKEIDGEWVTQKLAYLTEDGVNLSKRYQVLMALTLATAITAKETGAFPRTGGFFYLDALGRDLPDLEFRTFQLLTVFLNDDRQTAAALGKTLVLQDRDPEVVMLVLDVLRGCWLAFIQGQFK